MKKNIIALTLAILFVGNAWCVVDHNNKHDHFLKEQLEAKKEQEYNRLKKQDEEIREKEKAKLKARIAEQMHMMQQTDRVSTQLPPSSPFGASPFPEACASY